MARILFFILFMAFIIVMLALDLGVFHKKDHAISNKEAATWTLVWVLLAMGFAALLWFKAEWIHGIGNMEDLLAFVGNSDFTIFGDIRKSTQCRLHFESSGQEQMLNG